MTEIFLSRSREADFHVSFYSRFSRIGRKVSLSPLDFQDLKKISLSPLDFQDFWDQFLFLLSIFKILEKISLCPLDFQDFLNDFFNWSLSMICQNMLVPLYLTTALCQTKIAERENFYLLELTCVWDSGSSFQAAMDRKMDSENSEIRISIISFCSQDWIYQHLKCLFLLS